MLESFRGHMTDRVKKTVANAECDLVISSGMTSILQPIEVALNKPFEDHVGALYNEWIKEDDKPETPTGHVKRPSLSTVHRQTTQKMPTRPIST